MNKPINHTAGRRIFDLHCDTLTYAFNHDMGLDEGKIPHFALERLPAWARWRQCMAIFIPDTMRGEEAFAYFQTVHDFYRRELARLDGRIAPIEAETEPEGAPLTTVLTVEGGAALAGNFENLEALHRCGVAMMTLTWNGENELAGGCETDLGFTPFGKRVVAEMERLGMAVDVSHLSDRAFWELCEFAERPFAASHSNARTVCGHRRNLTDDMFREIARRGGVVGLNYMDSFIRDGGDSADIADLVRHVEHFLSLGGEDALALGSDFDGADLPGYIDRPDKIGNFIDALERTGIPESVVDKILFGNGSRYFAEITGCGGFGHGLH